MNKPAIKAGLAGLAVFAILFVAGLAQGQAPVQTQNPTQSAPAPLGSSVPAGPVSVTPGVTAPAAPAAAETVNVSPEMRAVIKELLDATRFKEGIKSAYQGMSQALPGQMAQMINIAIERNTQLTDEQKKQLRERLNKSFEPAAKEAVATLQDPKLLDEATNGVYPIYAKYYTLPELKQLVAFYKSPIGVKTVTTMPQVMNDNMKNATALLQPRVIPILEKLMKKEVEAVQKK